MALPSCASFKSKRNASKQFEIKGTKSYLINNHLLVSSGVPTLDSFLGGGLIVGSVYLIEEDYGGVYSKQLLKYFLAEGVVLNHEIFLSSLDNDPYQLIEELPTLINYEPIMENVDDNKVNEDDVKLKIAWRYKNLDPTSLNNKSESFGHYFDLSKQMNSKLIEQCIKTLYDHQILKNYESSIMEKCQNLYKNIETHIEKGNFSTLVQVKHENLLRIGLHSLGSPFWGNSCSDDYSSSLCLFLVALRKLLRNSFAVCLITIPTYLFQKKYIISRLENLIDGVIRLESFIGTPMENEPIFSNYDGLFHLVKQPCLNSLVPNNLENVEELAFKQKKKRFTIEKLHLPPLFTNEKDKSKTQSSAFSYQDQSIGCSTALGSKLDF